ncbi:MAG: D-alanyl-D-alanine carboxypeptidase, partial [Clostridia bacterium]
MLSTCSTTNTNKLIDPDSQFYCEGVVGLKTGHTDEAGYCLLSAAKINGVQVIIAVFECKTSDSRFEDALCLLT